MATFTTLIEAIKSHAIWPIASLIFLAILGMPAVAQDSGAASATTNQGGKTEPVPQEALAFLSAGVLHDIPTNVSKNRPEPQFEFGYFFGDGGNPDFWFISQPVRVAQGPTNWYFVVHLPTQNSVSFAGVIRYKDRVTGQRYVAPTSGSFP